MKALNSLIALSYSVSQTQEFCFDNKSLSGLTFRVSCGINFPNWFTIPWKLCTSLIFEGSCIFLIASVFPESGLIPSAEMVCPRKWISLFDRSHLSTLSIIWAFWIFCNNMCKHASCSSCQFPDKHIIYIRNEPLQSFRNVWDHSALKMFGN